MNSHTSNDQLSSDIATLDSGGFIVVWLSKSSGETFGEGIYA